MRGISKPSQTDLADLSVQVLALQSGGLTINSTDIGGTVRQCLADSESWYEIGFIPPGTEIANEYHHVEVKVARLGALVRTQDGYYAQP